MPDVVCRPSTGACVDESRDDARGADSGCATGVDEAPPGAPAPSADDCICYVRAGRAGDTDAGKGRRAAETEQPDR